MDRPEIVVVCVPPEENFISVAIRHKQILNYIENRYQSSVLYYSKKDFVKMDSNPYKKIKIGFYKALRLGDFISAFEDAYLARLIQHISIHKPSHLLFLVKPFYLITIASRIKRLFPNIVVILDLSDPCFSNYNRLYFKQLYVKNFEFKNFAYIDMLVVLNCQIKEYYQDKVKAVCVVAQGITEFSKYDLPVSNEGSGDSQCTIITYGGKFHKKLRDPSTFLQAINKIDVALRLCFFTNWSKNYFVDYMDKGSTIDINEIVSQTELFKAFQNTDIILHLDNFYGNQVPGKTLELLQFSKPILFIYVDENSDTFKFYQDFEGVVMSKNNLKNIQEAVFEVIKLKGVTFKRDVSMYYWPNILKRYDDIFLI